MPTVRANGIEQRYERSGSGAKTIIWIHGIGNSHHAWDGLLDEFPGFEHVAYDVRGMGESEGSDGPVSLELWAQDCDALAEELGIESAIIAGHSMGGAIAQRIAIDFPNRVDGLFLLATSSRVGEAATANWMKRADEIESTDPRLAAARRSVAKYNMDEELRSVRTPTLVMVGDQDPTTPAGGSVIISRCIEGAELEIYPGIAHMPLREEPQANGRLNQWLEQFRSAN